MGTFYHFFCPYNVRCQGFCDFFTVRLPGTSAQMPLFPVSVLRGTVYTKNKLYHLYLKLKEIINAFLLVMKRMFSILQYIISRR